MHGLQIRVCVVPFPLYPPRKLRRLTRCSTKAATDWAEFTLRHRIIRRYVPPKRRTIPAQQSDATQQTVPQMQHCVLSSTSTVLSNADQAFSQFKYYYVCSRSGLENRN